jgi:hypothetical protein
MRVAPGRNKEEDPHHKFRAKVVVERRHRLGGSCCVREDWIAPGALDILKHMIINNRVNYYKSFEVCAGELTRLLTRPNCGEEPMQSVPTRMVVREVKLRCH